MITYEEYEKIRDSKGFKNADVARIAQIPPSTFTDWKQGKSIPKIEKMQKIMDALEIKEEKYSEKQSISGKKYYFSDETAEMAQELFENSEMRVLFDVQKDMEPEDMKAMYNMALALKRKERGTDD